MRYVKAFFCGLLYAYVAIGSLPFLLIKLFEDL